jgi:CRP-like cAMP-binding protein
MELWIASINNRRTHSEILLDSSYLREPTMPLVIATKTKRDFNPKTFLATIGEGRKIVSVAKKQTIYAQGAACDAVFYIQAGKVRLTVVAKNGKEATIGILNPGDFFGEGGLAGQPLRMGSATALTNCELMRIEKRPMMLALQQQHKLSDCLPHFCWGGTFDTKPTWSTNSSTPVRRD